MSQHTAGPWHYNPKQLSIFSKRDDREVIIAELRQYETDKEEVESNANLISAAPDLWLAALAALSLLSGSIDAKDKEFVTEDLMRACLRAEGKQP